MANLSVGIVGLPNVGKSTLFNALLKKQQAFAANYPFATIEPNVGIVPVPDTRLAKLAEVVAQESTSGESKATPEVFLRPPIVPATVNFVDIAGLVRGASQGAGLGNKFLAHIREVNIIAHVVRAFEDENIIKEGAVDPKSDYETIQTELILADLQLLEKRKAKSEKLKTKTNSLKLLTDKVFDVLNQGKPARNVELNEEEKEELRQLFLLTAKPEIVVLNVSEERYNPAGISDVLDKYSGELGADRDKCIVICAKIEAELATLSDEEQKEYLRGLGLEYSGLERLIKKAYDTLGLMSFLTAGVKEVRAWTIRNGTKARDAAGVVHTDFKDKFIKAEVISFDDYMSVGGRKKAREAGKVRFEGKDYIMREGDVAEFKTGS